MTTFRTSRTIAASPEAIFTAIQDPTKLAQWWGPDGFTNTFDVFEFRPQGRWVFTMHGPDGQNYPNVARFITIEPHRQVVIAHECAPYFSLALTLDRLGDATHVLWEQAFVDATVAESVRAIVVPANEQNLDRLTRVVCA
jgi:Activator of Hsp90 ATPase homolog 1-like protein